MSIQRPTPEGLLPSVLAEAGGGPGWALGVAAPSELAQLPADLGAIGLIGHCGSGRGHRSFGLDDPGVSRWETILSPTSGIDHRIA
jgi:hypothetical protein